MHPYQPALGSQIAQIAANGVFRNAQIGGEVRRHQPAIPAKPIQK